MARSPLRITLAQIDTRPGDLPGNLEAIQREVEAAVRAQSRLVVLPELAILGYCPRDLLLNGSFLDAVEAAEARIAEWSRDCAILVGSAWRREGRGRRLFNGALLFDGGELKARVRKTLLPHYDVFDEARWFEPGEPGPVVELDGWRLGITICEDLWFDVLDPEVPLYDRDPAGELVAAGAELILNLSASPYSQGKPEFRRELVSRSARRLERPLILCNLVGGNDELLFDGGSCAADATGAIRASAPLFEEASLQIVVGETGEIQGRGEPWPEAAVQLRQALVMGLRDYARKCGFERAVLGLSGGIDSAVAACLCAEALGAENVQGLALPARYSSEGSRNDAADLARRLGIEFAEVPIHAAYDTVLELALSVVGPGPFGAMEENLQARIRGLLLMAVSNRRGSLLVTTGNKSELAVGYCTLYGDMSGGLAVISDVLKGDVYAVARLYADEGLLPEASITKPPSAELRPDQKDEDSLPPYPILDEILRLHVVESLGFGELRRCMPEVEPETISWVLRQVAMNEYKRKQAAPGLRVSTKAFGYGRRIPIVSGPMAWLSVADGDGHEVQQ